MLQWHPHRNREPADHRVLALSLPTLRAPAVAVSKRPSANRRLLAPALPQFSQSTSQRPSAKAGASLAKRSSLFLPVKRTPRLASRLPVRQSGCHPLTHCQTRQRCASLWSAMSGTKLTPRIPDHSSQGCGRNSKAACVRMYGACSRVAFCSIRPRRAIISFWPKRSLFAPALETRHRYADRARSLIGRARVQHALVVPLRPDER